MGGANGIVLSTLVVPFGVFPWFSHGFPMVWGTPFKRLKETRDQHRGWAWQLIALVTQ